MSKVHSSANSSARFYLWAGLFLLVFQLAAFIRLTFWELSWDVMEPIGFFVQLGTGIRAFPSHPPLPPCCLTPQPWAGSPKVKASDSFGALWARSARWVLRRGPHIQLSAT